MYLKGIINNSVIICDEIMNVIDSASTNVTNAILTNATNIILANVASTVSINSDDKKSNM